LPVATGLAVILQHTPRAVTVAPPSAVTLPPPAADVVVIDEITVVVTVGNATADVVEVKDSSLPYAVPTLFVAYALT